VHSIIKINQKAPNRPSTQEVPPCNEPPLGDAVFGNVWPGAVHASDIFKGLSDPGVGLPADEGPELFGKALDVWLKCFRPKSDD